MLTKYIKSNDKCIYKRLYRRNHNHRKKTTKSNKKWIKKSRLNINAYCLNRYVAHIARHLPHWRYKFSVIANVSSDFPMRENSLSLSSIHPSLNVRLVLAGVVLKTSSAQVFLVFFPSASRTAVKLNRWWKGREGGGGGETHPTCTCYQQLQAPSLICLSPPRSPENLCAASWISTYSQTICLTFPRPVPPSLAPSRGS